MRYEISGGRTFKQVTRYMARKLFLQQVTIYMIPTKCVFSFSGPWITPYDVNINNENVGDTTFEAIANNYASYNCNPELGNYPIFFIVIA